MEYDYDNQFSYKIIVFPTKIGKEDHKLFITYYKMRNYLKKRKNKLPYVDGDIDAISNYMQLNRQNKIDITNWYKRIAYKYNLDYKNLIYNPKKKVLFRIVLIK